MGPWTPNHRESTLRTENNHKVKTYLKHNLKTTPRNRLGFCFHHSGFSCCCEESFCRNQGKCSLGPTRPSDSPPTWAGPCPPSLLGLGLRTHIQDTSPTPSLGCPCPGTPGRHSFSQKLHFTPVSPCCLAWGQLCLPYCPLARGASDGVLP